MKQIPILSGRCLVVELPEKHEAAFKALRNGRELTINRKNKSANVDHITFDFGFAEQLFNHGLLDCTSGSLDTGDRHYLFGLGWRIIGMLSEVTEEQASVLVEKETEDIDGIIHDIGWKDYETDCMYIETALESLESAIEAEGWYFENPYKSRPNINDYRNEEGGNMELFKHNLNEWHEAQSRTLPVERTLILEKI